jgi:dipeptidyl aminopeptidase/acylaminoacyl peptidase
VTSPDGRWVTYLAQSAEASPDLWIAGAGFSDPRRLTTINPQLDQYAFGEGRLIDFRSLDGEPLRAAVVLPAGYQKGKRYPTMVWRVGTRDSGSPRTTCNARHAQLRRRWPDPHGTRRRPAQAAMPDRPLVRLGISDPDRLAVMGQSSGGFSTALVTQTTVSRLR